MRQMSLNIGAKSKNNAGRASEQQPILGILSTDKENNFPPVPQVKTHQ